MKKEGQKNISVVSVLLSLIAGYADTTTFISADQLFSAHVTGNFVVFVYNLVTQAEFSIWLNLLSFPFFIAAVSLGSFIIKDVNYPNGVLRVISVLLVIVGIVAMVFKLTGMESRQSVFLLSMAIVVAMGLQNAIGKLFPKTTYAPTTVMTGNVTQITMDFTNYLRGKTDSIDSMKSLKRQGLVIGGFLMGCLLGGVLSYAIGLSAIILPGVIMILFFSNIHKTTN